jgi:flavin reductase (DIM6/NTAB) family NADH-FMN oxidoreductase RutF
MKVPCKGNVLSPLPTVLIGSMVEGKPTYCAVSHIGVLDGGKRVVFSLYKSRYTYVGITEHRTFSVSIPNEELLQATDLCGTKSGRDIDKSELFTPFSGSLEAAPMIEECPLTMECELDQVLEHEDYYAVIGRVVQSYADEEFIATDGSPSLEAFHPIVYAYDSGYYRLGERIGALHAEWVR